MEDKLIQQIKKGSGMLYVRIPKDSKLNYGDYVIIRKLDTESI